MSQKKIQGMEPLALLAEVDRATQRLVESAVVDQKKEFLSNVYPLLRLLTESVGFRFADVASRLELIEDVVSEFLTGSESMILPELAARIQATFAIGIKLCDEVISAANGKPDGQIAVLVEAFRASAKIAVNAVADVTAEEIEGEAGSADGDGDDIGDDGDGDDGLEEN